MGGNEDAMAQEDYDNLPLPTVQIFSKGDQSTSTNVQKVEEKWQIMDGTLG